MWISRMSCGVWMGRIESIFYFRNEDALSFAFLAVLLKLSPNVRDILFKLCKIDLFNNLGDLVKVESQISLTDQSRPDGLLFFTEGLVIFENKVGDLHTSSQLYNYYNQTAIDYDEPYVKLFVGADHYVQSYAEIESELEKSRISSSDGP